MKLIALAPAALLVLTASALAQDAAPPPPPAPAPAAPPAPDALDPGFEVSLGRPEVKDEVARAMGVPPVDVPLTVRLPLEVARQVCEQEVFDSNTDTNRSCTATRFEPALVDAARAGLATGGAEVAQ